MTAEDSTQERLLQDFQTSGRSQNGSPHAQDSNPRFFLLHFAFQGKFSLLSPCPQTKYIIFLILCDGLRDHFKHQRVTQLGHLRHRSHKTKKVSLEITLSRWESPPKGFVLVLGCNKRLSRDKPKPSCLGLN